METRHREQQICEGETGRQTDTLVFSLHIYPFLRPSHRGTRCPYTKFPLFASICTQGLLVNGQDRAGAWERVLSGSLSSRRTLDLCLLASGAERVLFLDNFAIDSLPSEHVAET